MEQDTKPEFLTGLHDTILETEAQSQTTKRPYDYDKNDAIDKSGLSKKGKIRRACLNCRRGKNSCNGERPRCDTCIGLKQTCGFDIQPMNFKHSSNDFTSDGSVDNESFKGEGRKGLQSSISAVTYSIQQPLTSEMCEIIIKNFTGNLNETLPKDCRLPYHQSAEGSAFLTSVENLLKDSCVRVMHDNPVNFWTRQAAKAIRRLRNEILLNVQTAPGRHSDLEQSRKQDISISNLLDLDESKKPTGSTTTSDWLGSTKNNNELSHPPKTWQGFGSNDEVDLSDFPPEDHGIYEYLVGHKAFRTLEKDLSVSIERYLGDQMRLISLRVLRALDQPQFVTASLVGALSADFVTSWNPVRFLEDQYPNGGLQRLRDVLVVTGGSQHAQMSTVEQYLRQNWANHTFELVDHLTYVISAGAQGLLSSRIFYFAETQTITVYGLEDLLVTVGQQLAWLGAACCSSSGKLAVCYTSFSEKKVPGNDHPTFCVSHEVSSSGIESSSSCWHDLVGNSVIAHGFPISDRANEMLGLQLSVELMAVLGSIPFATYFDGGYVLKGRSFMIVPLQRKGTSVQWHLFQSKDNDRIKYEDLSELAPNRLLVEKSDGPAFLSAESFLGWCPQCKVHLATKEYKYTEIKYSQSASKPKLTLSADSFMIGFQQWGAASVNFTLRRNQGFYRNGISDFYSDILRDSANMLVVLYDTEARRAWQTDAETMILHTILDRYERKFFDHSNTSISLERADCDNPDSVRKAMWSNCNIPVEPDKYLTEAKVNVKQFFHIVNELYHLFDGLQATQRQFSKKNVIQVNGSQGCQVHGWEYLDIVRHKTELELRHEQLKPSCGEWPELMRQLNAVVLYGSFFQDVFEPSHSTGMCLELQKMPRDKDYLAMQVSTLNRLYYESGTLSDDHDLARITPKGAKLCPSKYLFDPCPDCAGGTISTSNNGDCCTRDRIQYLDFKSDKKIAKLPGLGDTGAIIIGKKPHAFKFWEIFSKSETKSNNAHSHAQENLGVSSRKNQALTLGITPVSLPPTVTTLSPSQPGPVLSQPLMTSQAHIQQTPLLYHQSPTTQQVP